MGKQIACELAKAGAIVLAIARRERELNALKEKYPNNIVIAPVDVCDYETVEKEIKSFVAEYGKISGAVHAAGITSLTPLRAYDEKECKKIMDISFWAGVKLVQICTKARICLSNSSFVLFSSVCTAKTDKGLYAYAAAKSAIKIAVKTFAKEIYSKGHRINTVSPGWVSTNMTNGLGETHNLDDINTNSLLGIGKPEYVSGMVLFLLSDRAQWITGTDIVVDGGYLA